jgi:Tfp pilus assembly protein PilE
MNKAAHTPFLQRGITLIQVMATLGLIGVIVAASTSAYLNHQNKVQIKEAFDQAVIASGFVDQNYRSSIETKTTELVDWSKGYSERVAKDRSWRVSVDATSGVVVARVLVDANMYALLLIPTKPAEEPSTQGQSANTAGMQSGLPYKSLKWVCAVKGDPLPSERAMLGSPSVGTPLPDLEASLKPEGCQ